jgi:hypothetical protein
LILAEIGNKLRETSGEEGGEYRSKSGGDMDLRPGKNKDEVDGREDDLS